MTKRVTFRPCANVRLMHPLFYHDKSLRQSLYYSKAELDVIDLESKSTAALFRALRGHDNETNRSPGSCIVQLDADDMLRGMEHRLFPTRQARRYLVRRAVLKYYRVISSRKDVSSSKKIEAIAKAASKLSACSREVAQETARLDSLRVLDTAGYPIPDYTKQVIITDCTHKKTIESCNLGASVNISTQIPEERIVNAKAA